MKRHERTVVEAWFGDAYARLHPRLQRLHRHDGVLRGPVGVRVARGGIARWIGERLRRSLGLPPPGPGHEMEVHIRHEPDQMHWERSFDGAGAFASRFVPSGHFPDGEWREYGGPVELFLGVELDDDGGWHWHTRRVRWRGLRMPRVLFPRVVAHKRWDHGAYDFAVSVRVPGLGEVVGYRGRLLPIDADAMKQ
ncbi:MAG: DUF4166 domain-containing protein [Arenimonas sp.]